MRGLSLVVASGGHSSLRCAGLSLSWPPLLRSTGSRCAGSVVVAHGPSCSAACGIFPDQGSNPRPLHWQADCQPLSHQGSPIYIIIYIHIYYLRTTKIAAWCSKIGQLHPSTLAKYISLCQPMNLKLSGMEQYPAGSPPSTKPLYVPCLYFVEKLKSPRPLRVTKEQAQVVKD